MLVTIDRFEADFAVVETENGEIYNLPRALLSDAKEGDAVRIIVDSRQTQAQKKEIDSLMDELFRD